MSNLARRPSSYNRRIPYPNSFSQRPCFSEFSLPHRPLPLPPASACPYLDFPRLGTGLCSLTPLARPSRFLSAERPSCRRRLHNTRFRDLSCIAIASRRLYLHASLWSGLLSRDFQLQFQPSSSSSSSFAAKPSSRGTMHGWWGRRGRTRAALPQAVDRAGGVDVCGGE